MKKLISVLLITLAMFSFAITAGAAENILYVAPDGSDYAEGTIEAPLATLWGARNKAKELGGNVTVYFRGGEYQWTSTVYMNAEYSNVTYAAYPGETPIFTGGYRVPASEFSDITLDNGTTVKTFNVKSYLEEKLNITLAEGDVRFYPLTKNTYGNDENDYKGQVMYSVDNEPAMWLARYPNKADGFYPENPHPVFMKTGTVIKETNSGNGDTEGCIFNYTDDRISKYAGLTDAYLYGFPKQVFWFAMGKIKTVDPESKTIELESALPNGISEGREYAVINVLDELDMPGEYYVAKDGTFYMYPQTDFSYLNISGSFNSNYMIYTYNSGSGASNVTFSGITFENTRRSAIFIEGGENVRIENCVFRNIGENAVSLGDPSDTTYTPFADSKWDSNDWDIFYQLTDRQEKITKQIDYRSQDKFGIDVRGKNHGLYGCTIMNTGLTAVHLAGGNLYRDEDCGYYVENCDISFAGVNKRTYEAAIKFSNAHGVTIKNNELSHGSSTMVTGYVTKGIIENNEIYDALSESYDMGVIYINYIVPTLDLTINNNYIHDVPIEFSLEETKTVGSQRSTIAFDNIYGSGAKITNNLIRNVPRGVFVNSGTTLANNIFIDCYDPVYTKDMNSFNSWNLDKIDGAEYNNFFSEQNAAMYSGGLSYMEVWPIFEEGERGDEIRALWNEKYPEVMDWVEIVMNQYHNGKHFFKAYNNLFVNSCGYWWQGHSRLGDVYTATAEDLKEIYTPEVKMNVYRTNTECFNDYENGDYSLTRSAKLRYEIDEIDMSSVGTY